MAKGMFSEDTLSEEAQRCLCAESIEIIPDKLYIAKKPSLVHNRYIIKNAGITDIVDLIGRRALTVCNCLTGMCFHRDECARTKPEIHQELTEAFYYIKKRLFVNTHNKIIICDTSYYKLFSLSICLRYLQCFLFSDAGARAVLVNACRENGIRVTRPVYKLSAKLYKGSWCPPPFSPNLLK
jgi:hypothetical protein